MIHTRRGLFHPRGKQPPAPAGSGKPALNHKELVMPRSDSWFRKGEVQPYFGSAEARFWKRIQKTDSCWIWTAARNKKGYGRMFVNNTSIHAHRYAYQLLVGQIPDGLVIDHLCRNRICVNPDHLEAVTNEENVSRGLLHYYQLLKTHCVHGHEYTPENTGRCSRGNRYCKTCERKNRQKYRAQKVVSEKLMMSL